MSLITPYGHLLESTRHRDDRDGIVDKKKKTSALLRRLAYLLGIVSVKSMQIIDQTKSTWDPAYRYNNHRSVITLTHAAKSTKEDSIHTCNLDKRGAMATSYMTTTCQLWQW